jgi:hypothetical protein
LKIGCNEKAGIDRSLESFADRSAALAATRRAQPNSITKGAALHSRNQKLNHKGHKGHKEVFLGALCGLCG